MATSSADDMYSGDPDIQTEQETITIDDLMSMPVDLDHCLLINKVYQELVSETIQRLESILTENLEQQNFLLEGKSVSMNYRRNLFDVLAGKRSKHLAIFSQPYFRNKSGFCQQSNEDTKIKKTKNYMDPFVRPPRKWTPAEKNQLKEAIIESSLQQQLQPHLTRKEDLLEKLNTQNKTQGIKEKIEECDLSIANSKSLNDESLIGPRSQNHDWMKISVVTFEGKRSPIECQLMWKNHVHPEVNTRKWTPEEDERLQNLVSEIGKNWDSISERLDTNRTALQCFERYKCRFNDTNRPWTKQQDKMLIQTVNDASRNGDIPWHQIAYHFQRTYADVCRRWKYVLDPDLRRGRWTELEDTILVSGVLRYGTDYAKIAELIPGRTNVQCRDRYVNSLDLSINSQAWTTDEDERLLEVVRMKGYKWAEIAGYFPGRTDQIVSKRYFRIVDSTLKAKAKDEDIVIVHPKTQQKNSNEYRKRVHEQILRQLSNENVSSEMSLSINHSQLDDLIQELTRKLKKIRSCQKKPKPMEGFTEEDTAFIGYFALLRCNKKKGRPFHRSISKLNVSNPTYSSIVNYELQCLGSNMRICEDASQNQEPTSTISLTIPCESNLKAFNYLNIIHDRLVEVGKNTILSTLTDYTFQTENYVKAAKWRLFAMRFVSLFFWPTMMAQVIPSTNPPSEKEAKKPKSKTFPQRRKRHLKKPWVAERMKALAEKRWKEKHGNETPTVEENSTTQEEEKEMAEEEKIEIAQTEQEVPQSEDTSTKKRRGRPVGAKTKIVKLDGAERRSTRVRAKNTDTQIQD